MKWTEIQEEPDPKEPLNQTQYLAMEEEILEPSLCKFTLEDERTHEDLAPLTDTWIIQAMNFSTKLAQKENAKKEDTWTLPKIVSPELHEYLDVFDKEKAKQFPESWPWDHVIELKEDFIPSDCKVYSLTLLVMSMQVRWPCFNVTLKDYTKRVIKPTTVCLCSGFLESITILIHWFSSSQQTLYCVISEVIKK